MIFTIVPRTDPASVSKIWMFGIKNERPAMVNTIKILKRANKNHFPQEIEVSD